MSATQRSCNYHDDVPAIAVCTKCGEDICGRCHGADGHGLAVCACCRRDAGPPTVPWESAQQAATASGFIQTVLVALTDPRHFFRRFRHHAHSWAMPAVFAIICILIGTVVDTLWRKAFSAEYAEPLHDYSEQFGLSVEVVELLQFAAIAPGAVVIYFAHTALVYLALQAFGIDDAQWPKVARITGYAMASYLLLVFPPIGEFPLGQFLMILWLFNLEVGALRSLFGLGFWKSIGVILPPFLVFVLLIG